MRKLMLVALLILGCKTVQSDYGNTKFPRYWKDVYSKVCFAEFVTAYGFRASSYVPCTPDVEAEIIHGQRGEL